ncbi:MAG: Tex family protein [Rhodoferax sp.]
MLSVIDRIAQELHVQPRQVAAAVELLDGGATVPFIARYRKEATGGLDDVQLRALQTRLAALRALDERRRVIAKAIAEQGKLTPALQAALDAAPTQQQLEDLYLPYKIKRRTKGQIAREAGLEPLADALWSDPTQDPAQAAQAYVRPYVEAAPGQDKPPDFSTVALVLDGARDLLAERWAEQPTLVQDLRQWWWDEALLCSTLAAGQDAAAPDVARFRDYFDYHEPVCRVPSHRALAVLRGRALGFLDVKLLLPEDLSAPDGAPATPATPSRSAPAPSRAEARVAQHLGWRHQGRAADDWLRRCVAWTWRVKLSLSTERDVLARLREAAEAVAIDVFANNLRDLLLAAPAGPRVVMGLDPGIRTGVKVAVVDATGKLVDTATVYPLEPRRDWDGALHTLAGLCRKHGVNLIAIGNGTASREVDRLAAELIKSIKNQAPAQMGSAVAAIEKIVVSEAGASVYSASELAAQEMPDVDVSLRGAASIARRVQDPLAELVKIDPKSIGVGQYQHDVNQSALARTLDAVVEDCVNAVGVDLNTASVPLLTRVSGLGPGVARALVRWREQHGAFRCRQALLQVPGLGPKTFEQSAGFLRIRGGDEPLDMTGVHPETYPLVQRILQRLGQPIGAVLGRPECIKPLKPEWFADDQFGVVTVQDILAELAKPGRDPRPDFKVARYNDTVLDIADLREGMVLEGTVSNVAAFGAFVDLGVHHDGLIHVSQLADRYVADARTVVKTGDVVRVRVLEVDRARQRISLSMRLGESRASAAPDTHGYKAPRRGANKAAPAAPQCTAMSAAFAKLKGGLTPRG